MSTGGERGNAYLIFGHKEMQYSAAPVDQNLEMAMMEDGGARYATPPVAACGTAHQMT